MVRVGRPGAALPVHSVRAFNAAALSDNKIHDDTVAKQYGFAGGLVPGVTVYAYMTTPVAAVLGLDWVRHGQMTARFLKPFYEGELCEVRAVFADAEGCIASIDLEARNGSGDLCAVGRAWLPASPPAAPALESFPERPLPEPRPPVSPAALAAIDVFGSVEETYRAAAGGLRLLDEIHDPLGFYRGPGAVAHPGYLIRSANTILASNVRLEPWIHVSSEVTHLGVAGDGDRLSTRGRQVGLFERKGHKFVELDVLIVVNGKAPVMRVHHTAIYDVRRVAAD